MTNIEYTSDRVNVTHGCMANGGMKVRIIDADALYNGAMKDEYFDFVEHDNHGRESFAYSCAMQRLAEAPTIDAIPVEWLRDIYQQALDSGGCYRDVADGLELVLSMWEEKQEAQNG